VTPSYDDIAAHLGARLCDMECAIEHSKLHGEGYVKDGLVHWRRRSPNRLGLYKFLKLVALDRLIASGLTFSRGELLWRQTRDAYHLGLELGVRFPREYGATDRARVREAIAKEVHEPWLREKIEKWAAE